MIQTLPDWEAGSILQVTLIFLAVSIASEEISGRVRTAYKDADHGTYQKPPCTGLTKYSGYRLKPGYPVESPEAVTRTYSSPSMDTAFKLYTCIKGVPKTSLDFYLVNISDNFSLTLE